MSRIIHLSTRITLSLLILTACLTSAKAAAEGKPEKDEKTENATIELQKLYISFLNSEGFIAEANSSGDVTFKREGKINSGMMKNTQPYGS